MLIIEKKPKHNSEKLLLHTRSGSLIVNFNFDFVDQYMNELLITYCIVQVLGDDEKRAKYDRGEDIEDMGMGGGGGFNPFGGGGGQQFTFTFE